MNAIPQEIQYESSSEMRLVITKPNDFHSHMDHVELDILKILRNMLGATDPSPYFRVGKVRPYDNKSIVLYVNGEFDWTHDLIKISFSYNGLRVDAAFQRQLFFIERNSMAVNDYLCNCLKNMEMAIQNNSLKKCYSTI